MITAWGRTKLWKRLCWVIVVFIGLGFIGELVWDYDTWPFSVVVAVVAVVVVALVVVVSVNGAGRTRGRSASQSQEHDPNRRECSAGFRCHRLQVENSGPLGQLPPLGDDGYERRHPLGGRLAVDLLAVLRRTSPNFAGACGLWSARGMSDGGGTGIFDVLDDRERGEGQLLHIRR